MDNHICPSSTGREGSSLLGLVNANNTVSFLPVPIPVTSEFLEKARMQGSLEKRFRFSNQCLKHGCGQWKNGQCGVINTLASVNEHLEAGNNLPPCAIRNQCRWFAQEAGKACMICPHVVTDSTEVTETRKVVLAA